MTSPLIDTSVFADLSDAMGAEFTAELLNTFLDDAPNMFADLKDAAASGDADAYRRAAHSIKSNADVFGATTLSEGAREMEHSGLENASPPITALEVTYKDTAAALKELLDE